MKLTELTIKTTTNFSEMVAYILEENGAEGASITDKTDYDYVLKNGSWDYIDGVEQTYSDRVIIKTCLENPTKKLLTKIQNELDSAVKFFNTTYVFSTEAVDDNNWKDEWKKYYKQITLGNVVINPIWLDASKIKNKTIVNIDPGLAFGTGQHQTTSSCIELMQLINLNNKSVIDVGCGSGILGITAMLLGANCCTFTDIEKDAISSTKENLELNNITSKCEFFCEPNLASVTQKFDVVVANMTVDLIKMLAEDILDVAKQSAYFIFSGIIDSREKEIENRFNLPNFQIVKHIKKDNWHAYLMKRN